MVVCIIEMEWGLELGLSAFFVGPGVDIIHYAHEPSQHFRNHGHEFMLGKIVGDPKS